MADTLVGSTRDCPYVVEISEPEDPSLQPLSPLLVSSEPDIPSKLTPKRVRFDTNSTKQSKQRRVRKGPSIVYRKRCRQKVQVSVPEPVGEVGVGPPVSSVGELVSVTQGPVQESYEVEEILGHRIRVETNQPEFLLKWKGYPDSENSWEPPANLDGCSKILHKYIIDRVVHVNSSTHSEIFVNLLPPRLRKTWSKALAASETPPTPKISTTVKPSLSTKPSTNKQSIVTKPSITKQSNSAKLPATKSVPTKPSIPNKLPTNKQSNSIKLSTTKPSISTKLSRAQKSVSAKLSAKKHSISSKLLTAKEQHKGKASKVRREKQKPSKSRVVVRNGHIKPLKKAPPTEPSSRKIKQHTLGTKQKKTVRKQLFKEPVSETRPPSKSTVNSVPLSPSSSPRKEQENVLVGTCSSVRTHPAESLKECPLFTNELFSHSNDIMKHLPSSPASMSPLTPDRSQFSSELSVNDSFRLHLSPSPSPQSSIHESPCNGLTSPRLNPIPSPPTPQSITRQIPRHLLHRQKLFSTPVPLPRAKRKNCLSSPVPTKAAKISPHNKRRTIGDCELPVLDKVIRNNRKPVAEGANRLDTMELASQDSQEEPLSTVTESEGDDTPSQTAVSPLVKIGRMPDSAASLLYRELLLNWQHELNKQRDGTDEFIIVDNYVDRVPPPTNFTYISSNHYAPGVPDPSSPEVSSSLCGCECYSLGKKCGTRSASFCCPKMANVPFAYSKAGKVQVEPGTPIYECNSKCSCPPDCWNKVVQHGRKIPLCVFRTDDGRGWGVKTIQPIKAHSFVTEYVGEVITSEEAEKRGRLYDQQGATYLFDLDFDDDNSEFTIDAAREGNISHFFNHSCQPNLVVYSVWIECLDKRLPRIAFFTTRNISAGEELTFDYQMNHDQSTTSASPSRHKKMRMRCLCGSEKCLGYYY